MTDYQIWSDETAQEIIKEHHALKGALLPILHALQNTFGYIDEKAIPKIADQLNLSRAEVLGVVSFYHDFRRKKPGRYTIKVCRAEACQAMGVENLLDYIQECLSVKDGETTTDNLFSLESVFCLGNCALSPSMMVNDQIFGRVSPQKFSSLIDRFKGEAG